MNLLLNHPIPSVHARATALVRALVGLWRDRTGARQHTPARARHPEAVDTATLRDLGIDRSELASFRAEAEARVELTRLRAASHCPPWV